MKSPDRERQTAIALRYLRRLESAPRVVAKGRGDVAARILDLARRHGVPVRPDADLAEILFRIDLGKLIPPDLYRAVAEVLSYLYRVNSSSSR